MRACRRLSRAGWRNSAAEHGAGLLGAASGAQARRSVKSAISGLTFTRTCTLKPTPRLM